MDEGQEGPVNNFPPPTRRFDLSIADDGEDEREGSDDGSVVNSVDDDIDNEVHPEDGLNDLENTVENRWVIYMTKLIQIYITHITVYLND